MKKTLMFTFGLFLAMVGVMSCGDSAADEARAKAIKDSLYNDSIMKVNAELEKARMDSMAAVAAALADSLAAAEASKGGKGGKPKPKPAPTPAPQPTPTPTPTPKTGKDAIKGDAPKTGKDAIKGTGTGDAPKTGKDAIKGK
jgi:hypothetical protein